jgi:hypothetical protein
MKEQLYFDTIEIDQKWKLNLTQEKICGLHDID